ncbi:hypothetical protein ASF60_14270 [Methylobacterium sp. Leaf113]|nr:hypothetical protein ASF60_14270 [Methylobacterium sp. Leaf113]
MRNNKLVDYLLDLSHPRGGSKARFFLTFGFSRDRPMELADALADHVLRTEGRPQNLTENGPTKLVFEGRLRAPNGREPWVRSVWQVEADGVARLVTVVPLRRTDEEA